MLQEEFKSIAGFLNYEVSNLGNVKSLKFGKERILKPSPDSRGYLMINLHKNGIQKSKLTHQLMAIAFLGHTPNGNKIVVDHVNNIKTDNRLENLQLITNRENSSKDKFRYNYSSKFIGVSWIKKIKRWKAVIQINGQPIFLGYFTDELEAAKAYQKRLSEL